MQQELEVQKQQLQTKQKGNTLGQVLELFDIETESAGVKQISVPAYQTSDGKVFHNKHEADEHEASEQLIKNLVEDYQTWKNPAQVGGWTARGMGDEFVRAERHTMERYTRYIISKIKG